MTDPGMALARRLARAFLAGKEKPTPQEIASALQGAVAAATPHAAAGETIDVETLQREFEANYSVFYAAEGRVLEDKTDHVPWLPEKRAALKWQFWGRYEFFLGEVVGIPPQIVARLNATTDEILARLEDPERPGTWDRRGLVVGNVQSGKTSNYSGLICKALDAGYKLIVVLAGLHKSLRSQTQMRIDQGIIGFDTSKNPVFRDDNRWIGVGVLPGWQRLRVNSLTTSANDGDFSRKVASQTTTALGGDAYVLVVKKQKSILQNLVEWAIHTNGVDTGKAKIVRDVPLLVIDDEADNASINTARVPQGADPSDYDPSAINAKIRHLLTSFEKRAYVGYTATPFANIFAPVDVNHDDFEDDIFPRSFIYSLTEPSNYVGPARVFGIDGDPDAGIDPQPGLPIVRLLDDHLVHFPDKYKKDHDPGGLPESLKSALRVFVLASAARRARGQTKAFNSMLIHVARFVAVQKRVYDYVQEELAALQRRIRFARPGGPDAIWDEFRELWTNEFIPCSKELASSGYAPIDWSLIEPEVREAVERCHLRLINGEAADILDYHEHPEGLNVIAIGGDKLSRGLTLEGLTVSYYLRAARMYDTLMQMGRWFGYRDGYLDLCRLYTTSELRNWYRHIALADIELRREFQTMVDCNMTPRDYGLRVRTHPDGLMITALNKSRYTTPMSVSFSGRLVQSKYLLKSEAARKHNTRVLRTLVAALDKLAKRSDDSDKLLWRGVPHTAITGFLRELRSPAIDVDADGTRLASFIEKQVPNGGLKTWSVLIGRGGTRLSENRGEVIPGQPPVIRKVSGDDKKDYVALQNANILSPGDQTEDFKGQRLTSAHILELSSRPVIRDAGGGEELAILSRSEGRPLTDVATEISVARHARGVIRGKEPPTAPNGKVVRDMRSRSTGLLIVYPTMDTKDDPATEPMVGIGISFPSDENAAPLEYLVNQIYEQLHLADADDAGTED